MIVGGCLIVEDIHEAFMVSTDVNAVEDGEIDEVDFEFLWGCRSDAFEWIKVA